jgi:hypothetical protein
MADAEDPWQLQTVTVLGMPHVPMAARFVDLDYELKKVAAGLLSVSDVISSVYSLRRDALSWCAETREPADKTAMTHRFWFCPRLSPGPRYLADDLGMWIQSPVQVQVLTEEEFLQHGRRVGAAPAHPTAQRFAASVTQLLATNEVARYAHMRQDFQVLEAAALMAFEQVPASSLRYLLEECPQRTVSIPALVGGIRRRESGEAVCQTTVSETVTGRQRTYALEEKVQQYALEFRGGVDAGIVVRREDRSRDTDAVLEGVRGRVKMSRPSADSWVWRLASAG